MRPITMLCGGVDQRRSTPDAASIASDWTKIRVPIETETRIPAMKQIRWGPGRPALRTLDALKMARPTYEASASCRLAHAIAAHNA
jgi:hypothetical protein